MVVSFNWAKRPNGRKPVKNNTKIVHLLIHAKIQPEKRTLFFVSCLLDFSVDFHDVYWLRKITEQPFAEIIPHLPEEILRHVAIAMSVPWQQDQVKPFVGLDQSFVDSF
jgi:hypothetical protein